MPQQFNQNQNVAGRSSGEFASTEELISHYGERAAEILNESHCKLEDLYSQQASQLAEFQRFAINAHRTVASLAPHIQRYESMENLLLDPNRLADYTVNFFTHVHPVPSTSELMQMQQQQQMQPQQMQQVQRAALPATPQGYTNGSNGSRVNLADVPPEHRWMVADRMEKAGMFNGKVLIGGN